MKRRLRSRIHSDIFNDGELLISIGDLTDKVIILELKVQNIKDITMRSGVVQDILRSNALLGLIWNYYPDEIWDEWDKLYHELYEINQEQWNWEDRVRTEKSWEAAVGARECNSRRVVVKNKINELFGYPVEQKQYKTKEETNANRENSSNQAG
jgi:hypothetical protein